MGQRGRSDGTAPPHPPDISRRRSRLEEALRSSRRPRRLQARSQHVRRNWACACRQPARGSSSDDHAFRLRACHAILVATEHGPAVACISAYRVYLYYKKCARASRGRRRHCEGRGLWRRDRLRFHVGLYYYIMKTKSSYCIHARSQHGLPNPLIRRGSGTGAGRAPAPPLRRTPG